jgi:LacI family transcriptional regulator
MNIKRKRPTIRQVAEASGVSTQTVSRVINNHPDVADNTRKRVKNVIKEIGYQPSAIARSLIRNRSYTLGVLTAGLKYIGPNRTLNGITTTAEEVGYSLLLKELPHYNANDIEPIINEFISRHVDGIIWAAPEIGDNRAWVEDFSNDLNIPFVFLTMAPREGLSIISVDNYYGGQLAMSHLIENSYEHIAHISGPMEWWEAQERFKAWKDGVHEAGQDDSERCWSEGNWSSASGREAAEDLFSKYPEMDAIFAANDQMALGALSVIHNRGLAVPDDIAVVGFDNIAESGYFWPSLTTIQHDNIQVGTLAVEELIRMIGATEEDEDLECQVTMLKPELLVRKSSLKT